MGLQLHWKTLENLLALTQDIWSNMLFQRRIEKKEAVVEGIAIVHVLYRVLYPQVHASESKKQKQKQKKEIG